MTIEINNDEATDLIHIMTKRMSELRIKIKDAQASSGLDDLVREEASLRRLKDEMIDGLRA